MPLAWVQKFERTRTDDGTENESCTVESTLKSRTIELVCVSVYPEMACTP